MMHKHLTLVRGLTSETKLKQQRSSALRSRHLLKKQLLKINTHDFDLIYQRFLNLNPILRWISLLILLNRHLPLLILLQHVKTHHQITLLISNIFLLLKNYDSRFQRAKHIFKQLRICRNCQNGIVLKSCNPDVHRHLLNIRENSYKRRN